MSMHLQHLIVSHSGQTLVNVSELQLERGRPLTIVGESGSGKSLLAHAIMGTLPGNLTARGSLTADGTTYDLADPSNRRSLWGRVMSLLPQEPMLALDPTMRAQEQVAEGAATFGSDPRSARGRARDMLAVLGLGAAARSFPHTLSGGMAQRVAFAAATIADAPMLIADEPSKGLDEDARADLAELLKRHLHGGGILLTITHDLDLARELGGDVLVMKDAEIIEQGPARRVLEAPAHPYTRRLIAAEPAHWAHSWMRQPAGDETQPALITAEGLTKAFDGKTLFADLSLTVRAGERVVISGPSGCGKTTLGNVLLRLARPNSGQVHHAETLGGGRLQKLYQDPALSFPSRVPVRDSFGDVIRRHQVAPSRLDELMDALRLAPALLTRQPGQVSGGELQRLAIIRTMLLEPALVFADEPTSRLDLITQEETIRCLMDQVGRQDCALLLVTHDKTLAGAVADRQLALTRAEAPRGTVTPREAVTASA